MAVRGRGKGAAGQVISLPWFVSSQATELLVAGKALVRTQAPGKIQLSCSFYLLTPCDERDSYLLGCCYRKRPACGTRLGRQRMIA